MLAKMRDMAQIAEDDMRISIVKVDKVTRDTRIANAFGQGAIANAGDNVQQQVHQSADAELLAMLAGILLRLPPDATELRQQVRQAEQAEPAKRRAVLETLASGLRKMSDSGLVELGKRLAAWLAGLGG